MEIKGTDRFDFDLSVVIITWKMRHFLAKLLESLYSLTDGLNFEVILVDNNSRDGTAEMVEADYPQIRLIRNRENRGVAPARNQAFRAARGRYVVTLDADMLMKENSLKKMLDFMNATPDAGICGCKLVFPDAAVQPSGRRFPTLLAFLLRRLDFMPGIRNSRSLRRHEMAEWNRSDTRPVDYVIGACQFIRREAMDQVGYLDEKIFYGPEDIDYCLRMYRSGWTVYYFADTQIIHYEQRITKKNLFSKLAFRHLKGILYLYVKYRGRISR